MRESNWKKSNAEETDAKEASVWSRLAFLVSWLAVASAAARVLWMRGLDSTDAYLLVFVGVLTAAFLMERYTGRLRLRAVAWQVSHDMLTGLNNRTFFMTELGSQMKRRYWRNVSVAVLLLDVDRFKAINDTLGHTGGDQLLREVGRRLGDSVPAETVVARLGADEFGIIAKVKGRGGLEHLGAKVVEALNFRTAINGQPVWANVSIGAAIVSRPKPTLTGLLSMADIALSQSKAAGGNQAIVYEQHDSLPTVGSLSMDYELRLAVERNQLLLHYQPVVDLTTGRIEGVEALVRWQHPSFGFVSPGTFIPMAEENGQIRQIGSWVLGEACRQTAEWHELFGEELSISINLSAVEISRPDIAAEVQEVLETSGVSAESVHLEITETALSQDETKTLQNIIELRELGTRIAVDDFGVGYSSLNYLRKFPMDFLKIDKSFVDEIEEEKSFGVIKAAIDVGHVLGITVIAEGVETRKQLNLLIRANCDLAQGFLLFKPMPALEVANLLIDEMYRVTGKSSEQAA